jgi:diguanylate cyclase (GGDEF)-like protein/PAS domain S-box-containing protein
MDSTEARSPAQAGTRSGTPGRVATRALAAAAVALAALALADRLFLESGPASLEESGMALDSASAFGLALLGLAATALTAAAPRTRKAGRALCALVAALALLALLERVFDSDLGAASPRLEARPAPDPLHAARMSAGTALALLGYGTVGALWPFAARAAAGPLAYSALALGIASAALGGLAALLEIGYVYDRRLFSGMPAPIALGLLLLGASLLLALGGERAHAASGVRREDERITASGAAIMAAVAAAAVALGFLLVSGSVSEQLRESERTAILNRAASYAANIENRIARAVLAASGTHVERQLAALLRDPGDAVARAELGRFAERWLQHGFSAIAYRDARGAPLAQAGRVRAAPELLLELASAEPAWLGWENGFFLRVALPLRDASGTLLGEALAEQFLPELTGTLHDASASTETGEIVVCGDDRAIASCFPSRFNRKPFRYPAPDARHPHPIYRALAGESGVATTRDYRGERVISAYAPVGTLGIAVEKKIDLAELHGPLRGQLERTLPAVALVVLAGLVLLRLRLRPLVRRLALDEERLRLALEASGFALWESDPRADRLYLSEQWQVMLGARPQPTSTSFAAIRELLHPQDQERFRQHAIEVLKGLAPRFDLELRVRTLSGEWKWVRARGEVVERDEGGRAVRMLGTVADISERKEVEARLAFQATHDALTGLPNRGLFYDRLQQAVARSRRRRALMAVVYLDVDRFKDVNDNLGHAVGDALLGALARKLCGLVRSTDTVARLGGDEFALILEGLGSPEDGRNLAEKVVDGVRPPFEIGSRALAVTASAGVAFYDGTAEIDPDELVRRADAALYAAKNAGRDGYRIAP